MKKVICLVLIGLIILEAFAKVEFSPLRQMVHESNSIIIGKVLKYEQIGVNDKGYINRWGFFAKRLEVQVETVLKGPDKDKLNLIVPHSFREDPVNFEQGERAVIFLSKGEPPENKLGIKKLTIDENNRVIVCDVKQLRSDKVYRTENVSLDECISRIKGYLALEDNNEEK
jgi:hypothetical protein